MRWNEAIRLVRWVGEDDIGSERDRGVQRVDCTMFARFHILDIYVTSAAFRVSMSRFDSSRGLKKGENNVGKVLTCCTGLGE